MPRNDYLDEDMPGDAVLPEEDSPACPIPSQPSRSPSSPGSPRPGPANQSYAPPQKSMPSWNMAKTMCQAGGAGLKQVIAAAHDAMPPGGLPVASERACNRHGRPVAARGPSRGREGGGEKATEAARNK